MLMSILFVMFLSLNVAFAADNDDKNKTVTTEKATTEVVIEAEETTSPEGLYCSVKDRHGNEWSCWLCDCTDFVKSIKQN